MFILRCPRGYFHMVAGIVRSRRRASVYASRQIAEDRRDALNMTPTAAWRVEAF